MGGCYSRPKELDGPTTAPVEKPAGPEVSVKPVENEGNAPAEVTAEPATEPEVKEEPLLDLSEPKPEADEKCEVVELSPEISELTIDAPEVKETTASVAEQAIDAEKEKAVEEKDEKAKESDVLEKEPEEKISA